MDWRERIAVDPAVLVDKPVIKGTRIAVELVLGKPVVAGTRITVGSLLERLTEGETIEQILDAHPRLTREAVLAISALR